jgi:hypothetical protein
MSSLKAQVGEKEASAIRKRLALWARDKNPACADCGRANPTWASVNLGVLVCLECAGRHRSLGVHVSKMRSISLDTVLPGEARFLVSMNNALANKWWEAQLNPNEKANVMKSAGFIEQKYTHRKWVLQDPSIPTPTADNVPHTHPWWADSQCSNSVPPLSPPPFPAQIQTPILARSREPARTSSTPPRPQHTPAEDLIDFGDFSLDDGPTKAPSTGHTRDAFAAPRASAPCGDPFEASESKSVSHKASSSPGGDPFTTSHPTGGHAGFQAQSEMPSKMPVRVICTSKECIFRLECAAAFVVTQMTHRICLGSRHESCVVAFHSGVDAAEICLRTCHAMVSPM